MIFAKAMLEDRDVKIVGKCREKKSFKDFDCRAEERNRSVGVRFIGRFVRFKKRDNDGGLPDVRDRAGGH